MAKFILFILLSTNLYSYELAISALFKNEANYLREWIEYHKMVGVEHFWMYNNGSTDHWEEVLAPYIESGLVEVIDRSDIVSDTLFPGSVQMDSYKDTLQKAIGVSKWVALIDIDEFLLPMKNATVTECLNMHYAKASCVLINWRMFGTSKVTIPPGEPILFRLTKCSLKTHSNNAVTKAIVRPEHISISDSSTPHHFPLKNGYLTYNGNNEIIHFNGYDPIFDGATRDKFLRINHYYTRDESFFYNYRLPYIQRSTGSTDLLLEHYNSYLLAKDYQIINFIKKYHPDKYNEIWKNYQ